MTHILTVDSMETNSPLTDYLNFSDYVNHCRQLIEDRRLDLALPGANRQLIIDANSPYELHPGARAQHYKYGALLVHGLFDCPFSLRDLGMQLQSNGIFSRAVLLPGHGTRPSDLIHISYHHWLETLRYGIKSLKNMVDHLFLVGYSTGAALSVYQALIDEDIEGIILLAPAIKIKTPADVLVNFRYVAKWYTTQQWVYKEPEIDYVKYRSIAFNPVHQVNQLTQIVADLHREKNLQCPLFMSVSREDETISSHTAIDFFSSTNHPKSKLLFYTSHDRYHPDTRIITRRTHYPELRIKHLSHVAMPFAPTNFHYGQYGDFPLASHIDTHNCIYGAYNPFEENAYRIFFSLKLFKKLRRELTYNPDFNFMSESIIDFIKNTTKV